MTSDIQNRDDIQRLIDQFYQKVLKDEVIGHVFTDTIEFIWDRHIPVMYDFWESVLFHTAVYKGNPMLKHIDLNKKITLTDAHFDQWLELWRLTVEDNFTGERATAAIEKSIVMRHLIQSKIKMSSDPKFIQ